MMGGPTAALLPLAEAASICDVLVAAWLLVVAAPRRMGPTLLMPLAVATMDDTGLIAAWLVVTAST